MVTQLLLPVSTTALTVARAWLVERVGSVTSSRGCPIAFDRGSPIVFNGGCPVAFDGSCPVVFDGSCPVMFAGGCLVDCRVRAMREGREFAANVDSAGFKVLARARDRKFRD